jgi:hypothetical protein
LQCLAPYLKQRHTRKGRCIYIGATTKDLCKRKHAFYGTLHSSHHLELGEPMSKRQKITPHNGGASTPRTEFRPAKAPRPVLLWEGFQNSRSTRPRPSEQNLEFDSKTKDVRNSCQLPTLPAPHTRAGVIAGLGPAICAEIDMAWASAHPQIATRDPRDHQQVDDDVGAPPCPTQLREDLYGARASPWILLC